MGSILSSQVANSGLIMESIVFQDLSSHKCYFTTICTIISPLFYFSIS